MTDINLNEHLPDYLTLTEEADWPEMGMEIHDVDWGAAEPDVGIMASYPNDYMVTAWIGARYWYGTNALPAFASALHSGIGHACEESATALLQILDRLCADAVADMEPPEAY